MLTARYTRWDGTQKVRLDVDRIFEELVEQLSCADDLRQAIDWMLRQGLDLDGVKIRGLDELLEQLRNEIRQRYQQFNLRDALAEMERRLEEILRAEGASWESLERGEAGDEEKMRGQAAARRLSAMLRRLESYQWKNERARTEFEKLLGEYANIRDLENFRDRYGHLFRGPKSLGYREAVELMREMERMRQLEQRLTAADFDTIAAEELGQLLGQQALEEFRNLRQVVMLLHQSGYVVQKGEFLELSPKGVRRVGQLALRDIYQGLFKDRSGAHLTDHRGLAEIQPHETRPYRFGDPFNLNLLETFKHALGRKPAVPLKLAPGDFEVYERNYGSSTSTVLCLDMSWSMSWEGRFAAAKKVAMAMETLIRSNFPHDHFSIVGFFTRAVELKMKDLPEASWNMSDPFTNLQEGLRLASALLARHPAKNRHIIVVTDGQPTAYSLNDRLYCEWPLSVGGVSIRAAQETLKEVERVTRKGVVISTFMLDDSPGLRAFVEKMTQLNRGRALYTRPDHLGHYLLVDYVARKHKRV